MLVTMRGSLYAKSAHENPTIKGEKTECPLVCSLLRSLQSLIGKRLRREVITRVPTNV